MHKVKPSVHLLAVTSIDQRGLDDYLRSLEADWNPDTPSDAEGLVETAGRSCYMSFPKIGGGYVNPNVKGHRRANEDYLEHIMEEGDGSILEHASCTWAFRDVSRVFTHELVRHRVGTAISQESLRFVRFEDMGMWVPEVFRFPEASNLFASTWNILEARYELLLRMAAKREEVEDFNDLPFDKKKQYTSAARRVAPIGVATNMIWSCNMRNLRHVIEQRTAPWAEEEIRMVFSVVAGVAKSLWPNLFGDYTLGEDGITYSTENKKV